MSVNKTNNRDDHNIRRISLVEVPREIFWGEGFWYPNPYNFAAQWSLEEDLEIESAYWSEVDGWGYLVTGACYEDD